MEKKRVVITGLGALTPIGHTVDEFWDGLKSGKNGVVNIDRFDTSEYSTRFAAQVDNFDFSPYFDKKELRRTARFILLGVTAAIDAIKDSGYDVESDPESIGVEIGSGIGGLDMLETTAALLKEKGPAKVSPFTVPMMIIDMVAGMAAMRIGAKGPNSASVTACASGSHSIGNAFKIIQRGDAKGMVAGGSEGCITPVGLASFAAARSLSKRNDDPTHASRPFDAERDGFVMGEGAGMVVLEEYEHAKARGAKIYAEIVGFGSTGDAYHMTAPAPKGEGANRAMKMALKDAGIQPTDIEYINAHGTSTVLNDKNETHAIKDVFGEHAYKLNVSSTKSMTGHLLGAAGAVEAVICSKVVQENIIPPTINYENPDPDCDLNVTPNKAVEREVNYAMSNSFGFGGHNAVLIIKKYS